jgi:hypothetical protein
MRRRLDDAIDILQGKLNNSRNKYNVEVLLSVAQFEKHFLDLVLDLKRVEDALLEASLLQRQERFADVHARLTRAHRIVAESLAARASMWAGVRQVWEKSWYPKGRSVGGRHFVHVLDDVKDHRADRRAGLDYMLEPLDNIKLEEWNRELEVFARDYAKSYGLAGQD